MALTEVYYVQVKNVADIFNALLNAQAPDTFSQKFLYDLGYTSINDRPFITVLKALKFLDDAGVPTQRYYDYLDEENSKKILAQGIRDAYADLFSVNQKAYEMTNDQVKSKLKSLLQGKKSESVLKKMATTFTTLCSLADFTGIPKSMEKEKPSELPKPNEPTNPIIPPIKPNSNEISLKYSINIELPRTRDKLIYDAIFKSIKENLL
jgi:hypothetical protein